MCGITFVHRLDEGNASKCIIKRYTKQKHRGSDGFGYIAIKGNKLVSYKRASLESQIKTFIEKEKAETILFHHRYPTSTPNFKESAHPICVSSIDLKYDYYLVHNGIISNADELKTKHEAMGFVYNTEIVQKYLTSGQTYKESCFNDSEALAIEVANAIDKGIMKIEAKGSIAFIIAQVHKSSSNIVAIYYARNSGNPLMIDRSKNLISIGSESEGKMVQSGILFRLDLKKNDITSQPFDIADYKPYTGFRTAYDQYDQDYVYAKIPKNPADTTFGLSDDEIYQNNLGYYEGIDPDVLDKLNELEQEILETNEVLDRLEENNDGTPESENTIIEVECIIQSLYDEREKLENAITNATLEAEAMEGQDE